MTRSLLSSVWSYLLFFVLFLPLEKLFSATPQKIFRKEYATDLLFYFGQALVWSIPVVFLLKGINDSISHLPLQKFRVMVASQPFWLQCVEVIILCDFSIYWGHRFQHKNKFLWKFHKVHHTAKTMDWLAAFREHPLDNLYTRTIENLPAILLGFPLATIMGFIVFRGIWGLFIHSNVTLSPGPLKYILGSPRLHHWHHEIEKGGQHNFANLMPVMDLAFGTYLEPKTEPKEYGIENDTPRSYWKQIFWPK